MSLEYEGQSIQSMKWNGLEILGGDSGGSGVETLTEDAIFAVKTYSPNSTMLVPTIMRYFRWKDDEEDVYRVSFEFLATQKLSKSYATAYANSINYAPQGSTSSNAFNTYYYPPEGWRPLKDKYNPTPEFSNNMPLGQLFTRSVNKWTEPTSLTVEFLPYDTPPHIVFSGSNGNNTTISTKSDSFYGAMGNYVCDYTG